MTKVWLNLGNGRKVFRKVPDARPKRSSLPCPMVIRDEFDEPVQSCANGQLYTSKSSLAKTHKASGNPHGQDFIELGNEAPPSQDYDYDPVQRRRDVAEAMQDVMTGNLPPEIAAIE